MTRVEDTWLISSDMTIDMLWDMQIDVKIGVNAILGFFQWKCQCVRCHWHLRTQWIWTSETQSIAKMDARCPWTTHLTSFCHSVNVLSWLELAFNTGCKPSENPVKNDIFQWMTAWKWPQMTFPDCTNWWHHFTGLHVTEWMDRDAKIECLTWSSHWSSKIACTDWQSSEITDTGLGWSKISPREIHFFLLLASS